MYRVYVRCEGIVLKWCVLLGVGIVYSFCIIVYHNITKGHFNAHNDYSTDRQMFEVMDKWLTFIAMYLILQLGKN